jgi:hypothetical protein
MNKKYLMFGIPVVLGILLVSAVLIEHYGLFQQEINVNQPIEVTGDILQAIDCESGTTCSGSEISISNDGTQEVSVLIEDVTQELGIKTTYTSELELTHKDVDFTKDKWDIADGKVQIKYTVVGNEFSAEVIEGVVEGYELIYYKDNSERFTSPAKAIKLSEISGNLPYEDDKNNNEYDYCLTEEYLTCHGAKIWYVPTSAINEDGSLVWSRASEFYFETELIQYNFDGEIITYSGNTLTITPEYELDIALSEEGNPYTIETQVNPIA